MENNKKQQQMETQMRPTNETKMEQFTIDLKSGFTSHRYKTDKGEISMVYPCSDTMFEYEIFCILGDLFDDIERYETIEESENRIKELLE